MPTPSTRRALLCGGAAAVAGALVASPAVALASADDDRRLLARTLDTERLVVWSYERVLSKGTLEPAVRADVSRILGHERRHVALLEQALGLPAGPPDGGLTLADALGALRAHRVPADPRRLADQRDSLRLLVDVESAAEGAWFSALAKLADPSLALLGAEIIASEAQHWTVLSLHSQNGDAKRAVPYAFVRG